MVKNFIYIVLFSLYWLHSIFYALGFHNSQFMYSFICIRNFNYVFVYEEGRCSVCVCACVHVCARSGGYG